MAHFIRRRSSDQTDTASQPVTFHVTIDEIQLDPWTSGPPRLSYTTCRGFMWIGIDLTSQSTRPSWPPQNLPWCNEVARVSLMKLTRLPGYAKDDVTGALAKDRPSAIKTPISLRENTIMKANPSLAHNGSTTMACSIAFDLPDDITGPPNARQPAPGTSKIQPQTSIIPPRVLPALLMKLTCSNDDNQYPASITPSFHHTYMGTTLTVLEVNSIPLCPQRRTWR